MNKYEGKTTRLKIESEKRQVVKKKTKEREKLEKEEQLKQNTVDIEIFYKFLNHKSKTVFQVFSAISHAKTSVKPSSPSKQSFILRGDTKTLLQLCNKYKHKGVICLGINERPNEQTKITDKLPKINDVLFDIDVKKEMKLNGISPDELKKEAKEVMERCKIELEKLGFIVDLIIDSGNGYHIHIKVDLDVPNYSIKEEFEETEIYKRLVYLENQLRNFNTKNVEIDFLSKDIVRRVKIAGTYNIKRYKDKDGKFKLMPRNQWRIAKILYLNENINEEQNNTAFMNLSLDNETTIKTEDFTNLFKPKIVNDLKRFDKLMEKDKKLKNLYNNELTSEYPSRSEAEMSLIIKLFQYRFNRSEINLIMDNCLIGKWNESPEAYKKTTIKKAFNYALKIPLIPDITFNKDKILQTIEEIPSDMTDDKYLVDLFIQIPSTESGFLNQIKSLLSNKLEYYSKPDLNKLIKKYIVDIGNIRSMEVRENEYSIEDFNRFAENDGFDLGKILQIIKYDNEYILETDTGITLYNRSAEFKQVLFKPMKVLSKVIDVNRNNIELFTLEIDGYIFRNKTKNEIYKQLSPDIQNYGKFGLDVIKRFITYYSEIIPERTPEYITGFNDGWKLPFNENEFTIINHSEIQEIIYQNIKNNSYQSYSNEEKEEIKQEMKKFLSITQMNEDKLSMIIGWSISAPFKMFFIETTNLFTYMYLCGFKGTGKSKIGDFFTTNLYKIMDTHLSSSILNSPSSTEDHLASSTFPFNVQEIGQSIHPQTVGIMKDSTTGNSPMIKKRTDNTIKINKLKVSSMMLDGNEPVEAFLDEAWNSKMIYINFERDEEIVFNQKWMDLFQCLKKRRLFSLIYDYTKDWTNKDIEKRIKRIDKEYPTLLEDLAYEDQRLVKAFRFIMFGIELFEEVFDVELSKDYIYDLLIEGRTYLSKDLMDLFLLFVGECLELGFRQNNDKDRLRNLPSYLKHALYYNTDDEILFTQFHLKDFEKLSGTKYNSLKKLYNLLSETLEDKDLLGYTKESKYSKSLKKNLKGIIISKKSLEK